MKRFSPLLALVVTLCASPGLLAQVELSCEVEYKKYILFEPIQVTLTVRNTGPRPIWLHGNGEGIPGPAPDPGHVSARLSFEIKNSRGYPQDRAEVENIQGLLQALKNADLPRTNLEKALEGLRAIQKNKRVKQTSEVTKHMLAAEKSLKGAYKLNKKQLNDPLGKEPKPLLKEPVIVKPHQSRDILIYINTKYLMNKVDSYRISAGVRMGNTQYTSPRQFFDVYQGVEVQKLTIPRPHREWSLRKQSRSNVGIFLFLRVDDGNGRINYGVHTLDRMIDGFDPQMIIDTRNRIHVLHRRSPKLFMHHVYTPEGQYDERNLYTLGYGEVGFRRDERGNIRVSGVSKLKP
ncbi:MAG: hypothetical protein VCG02_12215 [Verrucomicrobiota bacterium]